jgi:broad specificity phosphatase PhoE
MFNAPLTPLGHEQCRNVLKNFPRMEKITHVFCSPLTRTLETALECFKPIYERGVEIVAWDQLIEIGEVPCNKGDPLPILRSKASGMPINLDHLSEGWELTDQTLKATKARLRLVAKTLYDLWQGSSQFGDRKEGEEHIEIVVISHGTFLTNLISNRESLRNCWLPTQDADK